MIEGQGQRLMYIALDIISANEFLGMIGNIHSMKTNLPKDVRIVWFEVPGPRYAPMVGGADRVNIVIESKEFPIIPNGYMLLSFGLTIEKKENENA